MHGVGTTASGTVQIEGDLGFHNEVRVLSMAAKLITNKPIAIIMGSQSDWATMTVKQAIEARA